jgi:acetyltransferase-like isoleucine patch superfamily enzyme
MIWSRPVRILAKPFTELYSRIRPVQYARKIGVTVGKNPHFYGKVFWGTEPWLITIGDDVHITADCKFINHDGGTLIFRKEIPDLEITKPIVVGNNVYIGRESMILPGVRIGNNVVIGARSLVTRDIPDHSVAAGHPARVIRTTDEYLAKLQRESLHLGHLKGKEKDDALKAYYHDRS